MISPRLQTSTFTPLNTSNVFTSTLNEDAANTSFSSYHVTPRQGATPQQLSPIDENKESQVTDNQTYREVIKELSTQLQMAILENRQLKDKLNVLEEEHNQSFETINTQNQQLQESNFTLQEKINNLFSEIQQMQHQLEQKDQRLKEVRDANNNQDKMNHLIEENQKLIKIIETQQQEIKIQKDVIKQFESALAESKVHESEMANKAKDYEQMKVDNDVYKQQQQQYQEQLMLWSQRYKSLDQNYQIQYQDLFHKFNLGQNQLSELHIAYESEREESQRKIQYLMRELDQSKQGTQKKQSNNKVKILEEKVEELEEQLQNKKKLIAQLKEELQEFQNIQKIARQRDSENCQERKSIVSLLILDIEDQISENYEQRIRLLEEQLLKQGQQQFQNQQLQQQQFQQQQQQQQLQQQQLQQQQLPQQMYERRYRANEQVKMQLFSEKKDNYRPYYSFAKENQPIENKFPRTTLTYGNNY